MCSLEDRSLALHFVSPRRPGTEKRLLRQWALSVKVSSKIKCDGQGSDHMRSCIHWILELEGRLEQRSLGSRDGEWLAPVGLELRSRLLGSWVPTSCGGPSLQTQEERRTGAQAAT